MKKRFIEWKLKIVEKEIKELEERRFSTEVNLRKQKEKQWQLIEALENAESEQDA